MRRLLLPALALLVGCTGGAASPSDTAPTPPGSTTPPGDANWADPIVGDGQIAGGGGSNGGGYASDGAESAPMAPGPSSSSGASGTGGGFSAGSSSGASSSGASSGGPAESSSGGGVAPPVGGWEGPQPQVGAGILTAGTWDDNKNFSWFSSYRADTLKSVEDDGFLQITDDETRGADAAFGGTQVAKTSLDISLMIDTTGSMGDEIAYLQTEFTTLAQTIQTKYPAAQQHWSLVLYKDKVDEYVVKWFDFRADTVEFQSKLMTASAGGGGDFPESPEQALGVAHRLSWRREANVARLLFWVADAPHHQADTATMTTAVKAARDKNIHIYPVASSGVDPFTEYTMRSTAQITGGRYIFLTDDSGVGDSHEVPTVPCFFVTKLNQAILRMVDVEFTGAYREPTADEVLRTAGDPQGGVCKVSGTTVNIY